MLTAMHILEESGMTRSQSEAIAKTIVVGIALTLFQFGDSIRMSYAPPEQFRND